MNHFPFISTSSISSNSFLFLGRNSPSIDSHNVPPDSSRGSCRECLITGVLTCTGLSAYFLKLASELPALGTRAATKQMKTNKYFLLGGSAVWASAGVYRLYLG
jgi:hypothetical protein